MIEQKASLQHFASEWDAIEDTSNETVHLKARSELMTAMSEHLAKNGLTQAAVAKLFAVTQPRVSDLARGKIKLYSIDTLLQVLASAEMRVEMKLKKAA